MNMIDEHRNDINTIKTKWRLTLTELANESGVSRSWICRYLNGQHDNPTFNTMQKLVDAAQSLADARENQPSRGHQDDGTSSTDDRSGHTQHGLDGGVPSESTAEARTES